MNEEQLAALAKKLSEEECLKTGYCEHCDGVEREGFIRGFSAAKEVFLAMGRIEGLELAIKECHTVDASDSSHETAESIREWLAARLRTERTKLEKLLAE